MSDTLTFHAIGIPVAFVAPIVFVIAYGLIAERIHRR